MSHIKNIAAAIVLLALAGQVHTNVVNALPCPQSRDSSARSSVQDRILSGYLLSQQNELLPNVTVIVHSVATELRTTSDANGEFRLAVPDGQLIVRFEGNNVTPLAQTFGPNDRINNLQIKLSVVIAPIRESVVIVDSSMNPTIDRRNDSVYRSTLFERDDQLIQTLNAGIQCRSA